jgi:hypothetical protein
MIVLRWHLNRDEINGGSSILFSGAAPTLHKVQLYRHG